jgi:putative FmdB family regulatory protein
MPIYEYKCFSCGHQFERLVRQSSTPPAEETGCPSCRGQDLEQMPSLFAVSSESTRHQHRSQGRKVARKELLDQKHAEMEAVVHHHREHESSS